jgi:hypothetical protein
MAAVRTLRDDFELLRTQCLQQLDGFNQELMLFKQNTAAKVAWLHQQSKHRASRNDIAAQQHAADGHAVKAHVSDVHFQEQQSEQIAQLTQVEWNI